MNYCRDCKHWDAPPETAVVGTQEYYGFGSCTAIPTYEELFNIDRHRLLAASGSLICKADFGCAVFEAK